MTTPTKHYRLPTPAECANSLFAFPPDPMTQPKLCAETSLGMARASDPQTSHDAAVRKLDTIGHDQRMILRALYATGRPMNGTAIAAWMILREKHWDNVRVMRRMVELRGLGMIESRTVQGEREQLHELTDDGRTYAARHFHERAE